MTHARKQFCIRGHDMNDPENYRLDTRGYKRCLSCDQMHRTHQISPKVKGYCLRGHDLSDPANVTISPTGKKRCRPCRRILDKQKRAAANPLLPANTQFTQCKVCGKSYKYPTGWQYCSKACSKSDTNRRTYIRQTNNADVNALAGTEIFALYDRLERASTSWERADIRKLIQQKLCSQRRNSESS